MERPSVPEPCTSPHLLPSPHRQQGSWSTLRKVSHREHVPSPLNDTLVCRHTRAHGNAHCVLRVCGLPAQHHAALQTLQAGGPAGFRPWQGAKPERHPPTPTPPPGLCASPPSAAVDTRELLGLPAAHLRKPLPVVHVPRPLQRVPLLLLITQLLLLPPQLLTLPGNPLRLLPPLLHMEPPSTAKGR